MQRGQHPPPALSTLPDELCLRILYFLEVNDLLSASRVRLSHCRCRREKGHRLTLADFAASAHPVPGPAAEEMETDVQLLPRGLPP